VFSTSMIIPLASSNSSAHNPFKQNTHHTKIKLWTFSMFFTEIQNCNQSTIVYLFRKVLENVWTLSAELHHIWPTDINNSKGSIAPPKLWHYN
jgi:hypothetical protein